MADEADSQSSETDFGKDIIPSDARLRRKTGLPTRFEGYWKDVGTIDSLWEANMDLAGSPRCRSTFTIRQLENLQPQPPVSPPHYITAKGATGAAYSMV